MAIELDTIRHLCELSKLNYDEEGLEKVMGEMGSIIDLMDEIKSFNLAYDDTKDNNSIGFFDTREDVAAPSFPTEKLLQNTESTDGCYVVPKVVE
ncbi:MAG: aspartyl/glutamyl-tRNA amidotransferase subunit C [Oscillospiraceae bacterium]